MTSCAALILCCRAPAFEQQILTSNSAVQSSSSCQMRREIREAELAAARDNEPNPEELEKYIKERFGNRRCDMPGHGAVLCMLWLKKSTSRTGWETGSAAGLLSHAVCAVVYLLWLSCFLCALQASKGVQLDASVPGCPSPECPGPSAAPAPICCSYASYGYEEEGGDGRPRAVGQQALMPTATDPKVSLLDGRSSSHTCGCQGSRRFEICGLSL